MVVAADRWPRNEEIAGHRTLKDAACAAPGGAILLDKPHRLRGVVVIF